jgi:hypothetical protein
MAEFWAAMGPIAKNEGLLDEIKKAFGERRVGRDRELFVFRFVTLS